MIEEVLAVMCPGCGHPMRRHNSFGCLANAGACECGLAPQKIDDAEVPPEVAAPAPVRTADLEVRPPRDCCSISSMLTRAERSGSARMFKQAEKVREAVAVLEGMVTGYEKRTEAERAVAQLRQKLAEAEARLRQMPGGGVPTRAAERGNKAEDLQKIRTWAWENNLECAPRGRIPVPVVAAYRAAHPQVAA
jgi:plasmid stabilization system protein ParE